MVSKHRADSARALNTTYVGGGRHRKSTGTVLERENLPRDNPCQRSPGGGKEEDIDTNECNRGLLCIDIEHNNGTVALLAGGEGPQHGHEKLTDTHAHSTP